MLGRLLPLGTKWPLWEFNRTIYNRRRSKVPHLAGKSNRFIVPFVLVIPSSLQGRDSSPNFKLIGRAQLFGVSHIKTRSGSNQKFVRTTAWTCTPARRPRAYGTSVGVAPGTSGFWQKKIYTYPRERVTVIVKWWLTYSKNGGLEIRILKIDAWTSRVRYQIHVRIRKVMTVMKKFWMIQGGEKWLGLHEGWSLWIEREDTKSPYLYTHNS